MDKQPVGQLPDLTQSNNDDEIMVITNSEYNQLKKEKISDFITDLTSTDENNALTKGVDNKLFVTDFGNADNITEGTLPVSVLPDIPKNLLPAIETSDLPVSGVTAGKYIYPTNMQVNSKGQIVSVENGVTADITKQQIDTVAARPLSDNACTQENFPDEYAYWVDQAHSTFDLSKFEVVGSPTITTDGVASGFSGSNYITLPQILSLNVNSFAVFCKVHTSSDITSQQMFWNSNGNINGVRIGIINGKWLFNIGFNDATFLQKIDNGELLAPNSDYYILFTLDNNEYVIKVSLTNNLKWTTIYSGTIDKPLVASTQKWQIGAYSGSNYLRGSHDLKYFRVWVNGQLIISSNKTAIETIIAPNYEVVGSPTITADGILSGFSESNYIKLPNILPYKNNFSVEFLFNTSSDITTYQELLGNPNDSIRFAISNNHIQYGYKNTVTTSSWTQLTSSNITLLPNTNYKGKIIYNGSSISFLFAQQKQEYITLNAYNDTDMTLNGSNPYQFVMGYNSMLSTGIFSGSIDLNSIKIYSNGSLVYQPCLYIPYTETTDGTKVVDAAYYDRVQSCCEQKGQALYLTLDEQNQQYYLPQGTVSGMISQNKQGLEELDAKIEQIKAQIGFTLFDTKITDHVLSGNDAVGWALQGSIVTNIYPDAVSNIAIAYEAGANAYYRGIPCRHAPDGRYIAWINQKKLIDELYEKTGLADFYIYDSPNNQFYLPRSKWFMQLTTDSTAVNQYNESALPNITGTFNADQLYNGGGYGNGAFSYGGATTYPTPNSSSDASQGGFNFNASRSSSIYKTGQKYVQPPSSNKLLYYKVGNTLTNDTAINIGNMSNIISNLSTKTQIDEFVINGNTWYRKYSDGFVEQAGLATGLSANTSTINLPVSMANTNYMILLSLAGNTGGSSKNVGGTRSSTSSFTLYAESVERNIGIFWYVTGQGATS